MAKYTWDYRIGAYRIYNCGKGHHCCNRTEHDLAGDDVSDSCLRHCSEWSRRAGGPLGIESQSHPGKTFAF